MFYILATTILICASIYFWISKPNTNKITYNRRKKNIELFKEEEKNINSKPFWLINDNNNKTKILNINPNEIFSIIDCWFIFKKFR